MSRMLTRCRSLLCCGRARTADDARDAAALDDQSRLGRLDRDAVLHRARGRCPRRVGFLDVHHFADDAAGGDDLVAALDRAQRGLVLLPLLLSAGGSARSRRSRRSASTWMRNGDIDPKPPPRGLQDEERWEQCSSASCGSRFGARVVALRAIARSTRRMCRRRARSRASRISDTRKCTLCRERRRSPRISSATNRWRM